MGLTISLYLSLEMFPSVIARAPPLLRELDRMVIGSSVSSKHINKELPLARPTAIHGKYCDFFGFKFSH
jgi:hypothetical protein